MKIDVDKVAKLARLELSPDEHDKIAADMEKIVGFVDMLSELNLDGVEPTAHAVPLVNVLRKDIMKESFQRDAMLENAPAVVDEELIKVHQVIEE